MKSARRTATSIVGMLAALLTLLLPLTALAASDASTVTATEDLKKLSIEELLNMEVTSVSKASQPLSDAAAAIYVITHEDIVRSGARSLPEMLRLAPNLQVAQTSANSYVITARGFSGNAADQNLPNKLLVLIDGRSVYTQLYSGVYWDTQEVMAADIDRIEVISGPGATLWGANAVNGVINVITRKSADTQGGLVDADGGNLEQGGSARYGGRLSEAATYRVYADGVERSSLDLASGASNHDRWSNSQGGFRIDWAKLADSLTVQGDAYHTVEDQLGAAEQDLSGYNLFTRWRHQLTGESALQFQAYYDETQRFAADSGAGFVFHTYDFQLQHNFVLGNRQEIVWGAGDRVSPYRITNTPVFLFSPDRRTLNLANLFAQDTISLGKTLKVILGTKFEHDPYTTGLIPLPSARLSWKVSEAALLWAAVSRAVRSPTPFDRDVIEKVGATDFLTGGPQFRPEKVTAYETGYRGQLGPKTSLSVSTFYQVYDDLRSIEFTPGTFLPLQWGNGMEGHTYGVEIWGSRQLNEWWRLSAGFNTLHEALRFKPGSSGSLGLAGFPGIEQAGSDPPRQGTLRSSMNLPAHLSLDADLRYVAARPDPVTPQYYELNARLGWIPWEALELSLTGSNLLHARHIEYASPPNSVEIGRGVLAAARWRF